MKLNNIKENARCLIETFLLILIWLICFRVDLQSKFADYMEQELFSPDNYIWKIAIEHGNIAIAFLFSISVYSFLRIHNKDYLMNQLNIYHEYPYWWYWYSAKVLGVRNCNLVNTPIYMQVKLVINNTFDQFPLEDGDYPQKENEEIKVKKLHTECSRREVNLILEDTYPIDTSQIPKSKRKAYTIKISRNDGSHMRHYSPKFVEKTIDEISRLDHDTTVNVFATTNPKNMLHITRGAFITAGRGSVAHLYVFQQSEKESRLFFYEGKKIF